jgi:hypothetical protein
MQETIFHRSVGNVQTFSHVLYVHNNLPRNGIFLGPPKMHFEPAIPQTPQFRFTARP